MSTFAIPLKIAAVHVTLACNLACVGCNRGCFIKPPHTPQMTLDKFKAFIEELRAESINLRDLRLLGGEPTLHPQFLQFVETAVKYTQFNNKCHVNIISNKYSENTKKLLHKIHLKYPQIGFPKNAKTKKTAFFNYMFVSSQDTNIKKSKLCTWYEGRGNCGFSVDQLGYTICAPGGTVDSLLQLNARAQHIKQMLDPDFCKWQADKLCHHCGTNHQQFTQLPDTWDHNNTKVSKTWHKAILSHQKKSILYN